MNKKIVNALTICTLSAISAVTHAATLTFDDLVTGATQYGFDADADGVPDVILTTTDPSGFNTIGPGPNQKYIHEPGLEGTSLLNPDLRVDLPFGAQDNIKFGFALDSSSANSAYYASLSIYDSKNNFLGSALVSGQYSPSSFPEGVVNVSFSGTAAYALFDFTSQFGRYIIDDFTGNFGSIGEIKLLDPVPDFIDSSSFSGITNDADVINKLGRVVDGISADGASRLVIRIPAKTVNDTFNLTILDDTGTASQSSDENGYFESGDNSTSAIASPTSTNRPVAWVIYRAPTDYARPNFSAQDSQVSERTITIRVDSQTLSQPKDIQVKIVRAPVELIHGVWSDPNTWNNFEPMSNDPYFWIRRVDYRSTNGKSFMTNAAVMRNKLDADLNDFKKSKNVAAIRFDIVAHSMGGVITRTLATLPSYQRPNNFLMGDVHKLITIDTPHTGSQLAPRLLSSNSTCQGQFKKRGKEISQAGAVGDLSPGSIALNNINTKRVGSYSRINTHVIAGIASQVQTSSAEAAYSKGIFSVKLVCPSLLPGGGYQAVFGQDNDLIVGLTSMSAIGAGPLTQSGASIPKTEYNSYIHTVDDTLFPTGPDVLGRELNNGVTVSTQDRSIPEKVRDLLNKPSNGSDFQSILPGGE